MVVIQDGKITAIGRADQIAVPEGFRVLEAAVVTPGLIDAHSTVGFSGIFNSPHDQDQLERSAPIQPELRAIDAYNAQEDLIEWIRSFGVTTIHAGHAPGELMSGQTLIAKTVGQHGERRGDSSRREPWPPRSAPPRKRPAASRPARAARRWPCCAPS